MFSDSATCIVVAVSSGAAAGAGSDSGLHEISRAGRVSRAKVRRICEGFVIVVGQLMRLPLWVLAAIDASILTNYRVIK